MKKHNYSVKVTWTGNKGKGTKDYSAYNRNHKIEVIGKYDEILGSSDPSFLGDEKRYNPEELFLSSLASCHMLWYLHLCSQHHIVVIGYEDVAIGVLEESKNGSGKFSKVILKPKVIIDNDTLSMSKAHRLHTKANEMCFIANSCDFSIDHEPNIILLR